MANTSTIAAATVAAPTKPKRAPLVTLATLNTIAKNLIPPVVVMIAFLVICRRWSCGGRT